MERKSGQGFRRVREWVVKQEGQVRARRTHMVDGVVGKIVARIVV